LVFNDKYADYNNFYSLYLVKEELAEVAQIESFPKMEGRQMVMMIAPKKK